MSYRAKLGICIAAGLVGFYFVMARLSIESIIEGFLVVAAAVGFGSYYLARMRQAKNNIEPEIDVLAKIGEENLKKQEQDEKTR